MIGRSCIFFKSSESCKIKMDEKKRNEMVDGNGERDASSEENLRSLVNEELTKIGSGGPWVWYATFLCSVVKCQNQFKR